MKKAYKFLSTLLVVLLVTTICLSVVGNVSALGFERITYQGVKFENGGITSAIGTNSRVLPDVVRTQDFLKIEDFEKIEIGNGYILGFVTYSERDLSTRVASSGWLSNGENYTMEQLIGISQSTRNAKGNVPAYFRIIVANESNADISTLPEGAFKLVKPSSEIITVTPTMTQGTIDKGTIHPHVTTRVHTKDLLSIADYESVILATGYKATYHLYNEEGEWIGSYPEWVSGGAMPIFTTEQMLDTSKLPNYVSGIKPVYFRFHIKDKDADGTPVSVSDISNMGLNLVKSDTADQSQLNYAELKKDSDFAYENVYEIGAAYNGPWQEGAIFDGKLFLLNHDEEGEVHSLTDKKKLGNFICDRSDFLGVHSNSVCFGTEYYDENDKYPLMYISVYNQYAGQINQYEGHCGVYRIIEDGTDFRGELVQVIRIGFTEDLNMWKSLPNRGDVCPYGNFIVDTDNNDLYAFVMRDATQTTRFFKFNLPKVSDGEYNDLFGCKTVTLNVEDIKDQFDTEYSVYLQGADYVNGMIVSSEGLGYGNEGDARIKIIDLKAKKVIKTYETMTGGVYNEAEVVAVDPVTQKVYYGSSDGILRRLTFMDKYIENAPTVTEPTLIKESDGQWYYYENGEKKNVTTLVKYSGKWFYVEDGKWTKKNGFIEYKGKVFYVKSGKWSSETRFVKHNSVWYYLKGGKYDKSLTTLGKKNGKWLAVKNGKWSKAKTLIVYKGKTFYVNKGFAQLDFSGKVTVDGKKYTIKGGKVV